MTSTPAQRKAKERARRKAEGFKELKGVWVPADQEAKIKAMIAAYLKGLTRG